MAIKILSSDIINRDHIKSILIGEYGQRNECYIDIFLDKIFKFKKEIIFYKFVTSFFQYINMNQLSVRDQKKLFSILSDNSPPNETLKRAAKKYKERYGD